MFWFRELARRNSVGLARHAKRCLLAAIGLLGGLVVVAPVRSPAIAESKPAAKTAAKTDTKTASKPRTATKSDLFAPKKPLSLALVGDVEGVTEPYRRIAVACSETGIIESLSVHIGDRVEAGDLLASLESKEHEAVLELAKHHVSSKGRLDAALAESQLRHARLRKLEELSRDGFAHADELQRGRTEADVADAHTRTILEDQNARSLELRKIEAQLENRQIRAPRSGVIVEILKQPGEFVAPVDPQVIVLAVLDQLLATFSVPQEQTLDMKHGDRMYVRFDGMLDPVEGHIEVIAPTIDAESNTRRIQVLIKNQDYKLLSGARCQLELPHGDHGAIP